MKNLFKKYKLVLIPLLLVLVFDFTLLIANYRISGQLEVYATNINIAGRQRMLSQKITKSLLASAYTIKYGDHANTASLFNELKAATALFDKTLTAFNKGGITTSPTGEEVTIVRLNSQEIRSLLIEAITIWQPIFHSINTLSDAEHEISEDIIALTLNNNLKLLKLMNDLTNQLEIDATQSTYFLRGLQTIVALLVLWSFIVASLRLYRREKYYDALMEKSTDIVVSIDVQTSLITFVSRSVKHVLGLRESHYIGRPASLLFTHESKAIISEILEAIQTTHSLPVNRSEVGLIADDDQVIVADMVMQLTLSEDGYSTELSIDLRDISERKAAELALATLAHKDSLTGLPNRALFYDLAEQAINIAKRRNTSVAALFIDLDGFKACNDQFGHNIGDKVLIEVAKRMSECIRSSDSISRIGGDEFVALLNDAAHANDIRTKAENIINAISQKMIIDGHIFHLSASIGVAFYPENANNVSSLINSADTAMYDVKNNGKSAISFSSKHPSQT